MRGLLTFLAASLLPSFIRAARVGLRHKVEENGVVNDKYLNFIYGNSRLTVISRVHSVSATSLAEPNTVVTFIRSCESYATSIILCVGLGDALEHAEYLSDLKIAIAKESFLVQVIILPLVCWGKFTPALNAAISKAAENGDGYIAFQSLEFRISSSNVESLVDYIKKDPSILVIGPRMNGHEFQFGSSDVDNILRGRTCPWNTFAIWRTRYLALTGFPMVADGMGGNMGGVEEVTAITLLQSIFPELKAVLANIQGVKWDTNFTDPKRLQWHEQKMRSKDERPAKQLEWLGMKGGSVKHVDFNRL